MSSGKFQVLCVLFFTGCCSAVNQVPEDSHVNSMALSITDMLYCYLIIKWKSVSLVINLKCSL